MIKLYKIIFYLSAALTVFASGMTWLSGGFISPIYSFLGEVFFLCLTFIFANLIQRMR